MKINLCSLTVVKKNNFINNIKSQNVYKSSQLEKDVFSRKVDISFKRDEAPKDICDEFISKYKEIYGSRPIEDVMSESFDSLKMLNSGADKKVYFFPKMKEYLIAHQYRVPQDGIFSETKRCPVEFPKYNFGEQFLSNGVLGVMKCVPGIPNSTKNYFSVINHVRINNEVTEKMAEDYLLKLRLFKNFPQSSYDDLAKQIKYLTDNGQFIDFANPNNLLIDIAKNEFNLIDLLSGIGNEIPQKISENIGGTMSGIFEMMSLLLDLKFQPYFMDKMSPEQISETKAISEEVIQKVIKAAENEKLPNDIELIRERLDFCAKYPVKGFPNRFDECINLYSHLFEDVNNKL